MLARKPSQQRDTPSEVLVLPRPLFFPPICSFLKEIDDDLFSSLQRGLDLSSFHKAGLRLRRDLVIAGLPTEDSDGHVLDFHSLRATFGDMLIKKGVSIPAVARLMRHKDGGGLLLKKYTQGFEEEGLTITM